MSSTSPYPRGHSGNTAELRQVFICRVHQLIGLGYARMNPFAFQSADEPDITGELICAIDQVRDNPESEGWISFFSAHDDPPINDPMRKGKNRRRVDIRIDSGEDKPRQKFHFEAKRLGKGHAAGVYLGPEGLGRFLWGEYARDEDVAGMLGYVQSEDPQHWADKIQAAIAKSPQSYSLRGKNNWRQQGLMANIQHIYRTSHDRKTLSRPIYIYHTLLAFY